MPRFYALSIEETLFGHACLVRRWGRIGTTGRTVQHSCSTMSGRPSGCFSSCCTASGCAAKGQSKPAFRDSRTQTAPRALLLPPSENMVFAPPADPVGRAGTWKR
ncbi:WGR domain-containing protein [Mesorhizobium sp. M0520]|uniref:WGR domain-containing protein n=1 Tax=Mesorhizobium sp. M0520 TaxID=2956957 RepID=UPI00333BAE8C